MKHIESFLSFIVAVAGLLLPRRWRKVPPYCPCPCPFPAAPLGEHQEVKSDE